MSRAAYTFVDIETNQAVDVIEFELINNPGVKAWQYAVMLNGPERFVSVCPTIPSPGQLPANIDQQYQDFKNIVAQLASTDFPFDEPLPDLFESVDQNLLNKIHRHFTTSCFDLWDLRYKRYDVETTNQILQRINDMIHDLERYIPTSIKTKYGGSISELWAICNGMELSYDIFPLRQYHSYEPADLIMDGHILGKTLLESFKCLDDPNSWDTRGHMRTNGGAIMCLDDSRKEIYNSQDFLNWLTQHGTNKNKTFADFPLGNFVAGHRQKLSALIKTLDKFSVKVEILL